MWLACSPPPADNLASALSAFEVAASQCPNPNPHHTTDSCVVTGDRRGCFRALPSARGSAGCQYAVLCSALCGGGRRAGPSGGGPQGNGRCDGCGLGGCAYGVWRSHPSLQTRQPACALPSLLPSLLFLPRFLLTSRVVLLSPKYALLSHTRQPARAPCSGLPPHLSRPGPDLCFHAHRLSPLSHALSYPSRIP